MRRGEHTDFVAPPSQIAADMLSRRASSLRSPRSQTEESHFFNRLLAMSAVAPVQALPVTGRTRLPILTFATTLAMITYIDRVCISQAAPFMQHDLGLSDSQMGLAFSAFAWAYALFEIPGGWLGDVIGPRKVLLRVVIFWSIFTAATGFVWGAISLVLVRFLFGMGEAGCFPNLTKAFMIWLPAEERTRAQSVTWLSARWAGAFTPLLVIWVISWVSWRNAFLLFAVLGLLWAYFFQRRFGRVSTEAPESSLETSKPMPWLKLFSSPTVWFLWIQYFCLTYGWFFYVTWLPTYLKETRGLQLDQNPLTLRLANILNNALQPETGHRVLVAILAGIPLFMGGFGALLAGWLTPRLAERFGGLPTNRIDSSPCPLLGRGGEGSLATATARVGQFSGVSGERLHCSASVAQPSCWSCRSTLRIRCSEFWPWVSPASAMISPCREAGAPAWISAARLPGRCRAA